MALHTTSAPHASPSGELQPPTSSNPTAPTKRRTRKRDFDEFVRPPTSERKENPEETINCDGDTCVPDVDAHVDGQTP